MTPPPRPQRAASNLARGSARRLRLGPRQGIAAVAIGMVVAMAGCASGPPTPDWQLNAQGALRRAIDAQLSGNDRVAGVEFDRARGEIARTGRADLMARAELLRCAAQRAALQFEACAGFEALRADAAPPEQAYAAYLDGTLAPAQRALLPAAQQPLAGSSTNRAADVAALQATADPLSRLVAAALWLRDGRASPAVLALAVDTASAQGWRRPLLAWLGLQQRQAAQAGDAATAARVARRIEFILGGPSTP
jgi:hypothetical protein